MWCSNASKRVVDEQFKMFSVRNRCNLGHPSGQVLLSPSIHFHFTSTIAVKYTQKYLKNTGHFFIFSSLELRSELGLGNNSTSFTSLPYCSINEQDSVDENNDFKQIAL